VAPEYVFVHEWDVAAPPAAVFDAIADTRSFPVWWTPVYLEVRTDGPPEVGRVSYLHSKGRLPYHVRITTEIVELEPPSKLEAAVAGDVTGKSSWRFAPAGDGTHVYFRWQVNADKPLFRLLTPVLRPAFRWNHDWVIQRAIVGLEPYVLNQMAK
jgi:hypothetical protein